MDVVYKRCCGLAIHKKLIVACVVISSGRGQPHKEVRSFGAMTDDLLALSEWLAERGVSHVAMESTGVYWQPIYNLLEDRFELLLVNARHIKQVPGRKTDVQDCEWLADLLRPGLITGSFVPARPQREVRELTRYRTSLLHERTAEINRLQKTLEGANIKLASVASNIMGASGRQMVEALVAGSGEPAAVAELARGRLREKLPELERALSGRVGPHQRFLVAEQLAHIDFLDETLERLSAEIAERLRPFDETIARLDGIPGVGRRIAEIVLSELGGDVARFASARHLASWTGVCPGNHASAGKRLSGRTRDGNAALRTALVEAARAAAHTKDSSLSAQYRRLATRRGAKKAAVAVAHSILVIVYHMLRRPDLDHDLGSRYFDQRARDVVQRRLVRRLERLGYTVRLQPSAAVRRRVHFQTTL